MPELLFNGPSSSPWTLVLAHGAGAAMDSPFMEFFATHLAERGLRSVRFEFPYMADRRITGKKKPPNRLPLLRESWLEVIDQLNPRNLLLAGKSLGGRVASVVADETPAQGLICLGYPFHPVGKPDNLRVDHLTTLRTPTLILQGERDALGNQNDVSAYPLNKSIQIRWMPDGDHSFKPRKASGRTAEQNWHEAVEAIVEFVDKL